MNVALVTPEFVSETNFDGGLANYIYKLAKWLIKNNHKVTVYLTSDEDLAFKFEDISVIKIKLKDYFWNINYYSKKLKISFLIPDRLKYHIHFRLQAKQINDVVITQNEINKIDIIQYPHLGGYAYGRPKNIPGVARLSGSTELCQLMGGYGSSNEKVSAQVVFEMAALKKADVVFGPSKMIAALTEHIINKKIKIIETPYIKPSGELDKSVYNDLLNGKKYVLFFGSIGLIKGVGTICEIIHPLLKQHPDLYYVFVGKQLNNKINSVDVWDYLLSKAGIYKERVIYIPSQKHQVLFPVIQGAQLITLPSRTDNFPNTCIESMANGKIVIGTKGNGFDQLIDNGQNGFVIDVDDHEALLDKINEVLIMDIEKRKEMEAKAIERTNQLHPDIVLGQLTEMYLQTIKDFKN